MANLMGRMGAGIKHAWNAFASEESKTRQRSYDYGLPSSHRPDRVRLRFSTERSIIASIYNRMAIDVAAIQMRHVRLDDQGRYKEDIKSGLNECLTLEANLDQDARSFRQDLVMTMFEEGHVVVVPVETDLDPQLTNGIDIKKVRAGVVKTWHPTKILVDAYDERDGRHKDVVLNKETTPVIENPFFTVMNEPNSTLKRLVRKLNLLDSVDEQTSSGKLDMIIQLPYVIKSDARRAEAKKRRDDLLDQMKDSQYGIGYIDGTERITQLNRPVENNLLKQIDRLYETLYSQLGLTEAIMNGTADEKAMLNYHNRTVEPIVAAITLALKRKFLTKTARSQRQSIEAFKNPFSLVPINDIAEIADKFTRNEILTSNEIRSIIGVAPSEDPNADKLRNSNMPQPLEEESGVVDEEGVDVDDQSDDQDDDGDFDALMNRILDDLESEIDAKLAELEADDDDRED